MTDILFKGKQKYCNDNIWVEGTGFNRQYDKFGNLHMYIGVDIYSERDPKQINIEWVEIIPETLSQYTNKDDINGVKIFSNDIVEVTYCVANSYVDVFEITHVEYDSDKCSFSPMNWQDSCKVCGSYLEIKSIKIIGNIFDNKELFLLIGAAAEFK